MTNYGKILELLRAKFFLNPTGDNLTIFSDMITSALAAVVSSQGEGPTYPLISESKTPSHSIRSAILEAKTTSNPKELLAKALPAGLQGGVKAGHPSMVKNIIPIPSTVFLSAYLAASIYAQNGVTGEDSAEAANSELKIAAVLSDLAGYSRELSAGIFTFGGTGTNMYGIKMGLAKACPNHAAEGICEKVYVVGSNSAHYSHVTASDWLGIGQNNYLYARSHVDQSTDLEDLEKKCRGVIEAKGKLACIIGVAGTTSNMAIDDFKAIKAIRDKLVSDYGLEYIPHIHADSVVGWPYLYFTGYNFKDNPMGFSPAAIQRIKAATARISTLSDADSFGVDFHKTGFIPYIASMVICKNEADLRVLGRDAKIMTPLFHDDSVYNPGKFTLETSRSSATMLASWLTMQALGVEGYQVLIGHAQEMAVTLREELNNSGQAGLFVGNQIGYGTDVFVRCYPPNIDYAAIYNKELKDDILLAENSKYTSDFFRWLTQDSKKYNDVLAISKTSAAFYTESGKPFVALRLYMLSPYTTVESVKEMVRNLIEAKNEYNALMSKPLATPSCRG